MQSVAAEVWAGFERQLDEVRIAASERPDYRKWVRFYLDFCHKYGRAADSPASREPFLAKLASKNQSLAQRSQAAAAVELLLRAAPEPSTPRSWPTATAAGSRCPALPAQAPAVSVHGGSGPGAGAQAPAVWPQRPRPAPPARPLLPAGPESPQTVPAAAPKGASAPRPETTAPLGAQPARAPTPGHGASWEQEYRDLEAAVLLRNYSPRTLEAYRFWIARFQGFVRSRPTADLGTHEVRGFLSDLAVREHVAASTQNQAFEMVEG